jgi:ATP-dependent Lon protease
VLHAVELDVRIALVGEWAKQHLAELQVTAQIRADVTEGVDKQQREYLLRQQLAAIRKELGEGDDDVVGEYRAQLDELRDHLPEKTANFVAKEIDRLERMSAQSPEHSWVRTWLDRVFELPWATRTPDQLQLDGAREQLDADHYGLDDVKDRIVEFLAVRKLRADRGVADATVVRPARSPRSSGLPASARPASASRSRRRWGATSCASHSAACATRPRSAATAAPTSAASRAASCAPSSRPAA